MNTAKLHCSVHWCHKPASLRFSWQTQPQWASVPIWRLRNLLENCVYFTLKNRRQKDKRENKLWNLVNHYQHLLLIVAMSRNRILSGPFLITAQTVKHLPTMRETRVWSLGQEVPLEKEMAIHSSILAWKIPWMEEPGRLQSMGSQRVGHDWIHFTSLPRNITHPLP